MRYGPWPSRYHAPFPYYQRLTCDICRSLPPNPHQLLHVASTGATADPWVRMRAGDYVNLTHTTVQITVIIVAILSPRIYVYTRHWLLFAVSASVVIGTALSVQWTPPDLLPLVGAACLSRFSGRSMVAYLVWKPIFLLRVSHGRQTFGKEVQRSYR